MPALERAARTSGAWPAVAAYWRRRAARMLPAYSATLLLLAFALPSVPPDGMPALARAVPYGTGPPPGGRSGWLRSVALLANLAPERCCGEGRRR